MPLFVVQLVLSDQSLGARTRVRIDMQDAWQGAVSKVACKLRAAGVDLRSRVDGSDQWLACASVVVLAAPMCAAIRPYPLSPLRGWGQQSCRAC